MAFTNETKHTTVFTPLTKIGASFGAGVNYLKKEDDFYLLLENGMKIMLDQSWGNKKFTTFTNVAKS